MWFKLNTTFTQSLGTLSSLSNSWSITRNLTNFSTDSTVTSVAKNGSYSATFTLNDGCTYSSHSVTMGGSAVTSGVTLSSDKKTLTVSISKVTGAVVITAVATGASSGGSGGEGGSGGTYTITYKYMSGSTEIKAATTETVSAGTSKTFSINNAPSISGYTVSSVSPTSATINSNTTVTYYYSVVNSGDGSTITTTYTNAGYVLASTGALTGTSSTWIHSDFIPISSLADNNDGICVGTFVGHGTVAAIAFYTEKDNYNSFTEGYILSATSAKKTTQSVAEVKANITNNSAQYVVFSTDGSKETLSVTTGGSSDVTPEPDEPEDTISGINYYEEPGYINITTGQITNTSSTWIHSDFIKISELQDDATLGHCIGKFTGHAQVADIAFYSSNNFNSFIVGKSSAGATKTVSDLQELMTSLNATSATHIVISTDKTKNQLYANLK